MYVEYTAENIITWWDLRILAQLRIVENNYYELCNENMTLPQNKDLFSYVLIEFSVRRIKHQLKSGLKSIKCNPKLYSACGKHCYVLLMFIKKEQNCILCA